MSDIGKVQVYIRSRPLLPREKKGNTRRSVEFPSDKKKLLISDGDKESKEFAFDYVYDEQQTQERIFDECVKPLIHGCFLGYNAAVLAYGQTGSGKTYTMGSSPDFIATENEGVIPRSIRYIYHLITTEHTEKSISLRVCFLEIYNEEIRDLLHPKIPSRDIIIREDETGKICTTGAKEENVNGIEDVFRFLEKGSKNRTVGDTLMNDVSSRSHAIFTISIEIMDWKTVGNALNDEDDVIAAESVVDDYVSALTEPHIVDTGVREVNSYVARLHLVDLAGCERAKRTGASGVRLKESVGINQGLLALGKVIRALSAGASRSPTKKPVPSSRDSVGGTVASRKSVGGAGTNKQEAGYYVPYRESKLTRYLQDSLGGNSRTLMMACISPLVADYSETLNTLQYATRAREVENEVKANVSVARISAEEERQMKALLMSQNKEREVNTQQLYEILAQGSSDAAAAASKRVEKLEKELAQCREDLKRDQELFEEVVLERKEHKRQLKELKENMEYQNEEVKISANRKESDLKSCQAEKQEIQQMFNDLELEYQQSTVRHESDLARERHKRDLLKAELDRLDEQLKESAGHALAAERALQEKAAEMEELRDYYEIALEKDHVELEQLRGQLSVAEAASETMGYSVTELERLNRSLEEELLSTRDEHHAQIAHVRMQLEQSSKDCAQFEELLRNSELDNNQWMHRAKELEFELSRKTKDLESTQNIYSGQLAAMEDEIAELQSRLKDSNAENSDLRVTVKRLERDYEQLAKENKDTVDSESKRNQALQNEIENLDEALRAAQAEKNKLQRSNNQIAMLMQQQGQQHQSALSAERDIMEELRQQVRELMEKEQRMNLEMDRLKRHADELAIEKTQLEEEYAISAANDQQTIDFVRSELSTLNADMKGVLAENDALKRSINRLELDLQFQGQELSSTVEMERQNLESLQEELLGMEEKLRAAEHEASGMKWKVNELELQLEQETEERKAALAHAKKTIEALKHDMEEKENEAARIAAEKDGMNRRVKELEEELENSQATHRAAEQNGQALLASVQEEISRLEEQLAVAHATNHKQKSYIETLEKEFEKLDKQQEEFHSSSVADQQRIADLLDQISELERTVQSVDEEKEAIKRQLAKSEDDMKSVMRAVEKSKSEDAEKLNASLAKDDRILSLESENATLKRTVDKLQTQLNGKEEAVQHALTRSKSLSEKWQEDTTTLQNELHGATKQYHEALKRVQELESHLRQSESSAERIASHERKEEALRKDLNTALETLQAQDMANSKLQRQVDELLLELADTRESREKEQSTNRNKLSELTKEVSSLTRQLHDAKSSEKALQDHIAHVRSEFYRQQSEFEEDSKRARDAVKHAEKKFRTCEKSANKLNRQLEESEERISELEETINGLQRRIGLLEKENKDLGASYRQENMRLEVAEWELSTLSSQVEALSEENAILEKQSAEAKRASRRMSSAGYWDSAFSPEKSPNSRRQSNGRYSLSSVNGTTPPSLPSEDVEICRKLSDWLQNVAGVVPSKCGGIAAVLVHNGQSSIKRIANSIRKDRDYLLALGLDDGDADEIFDALAVEFPEIVSRSVSRDRSV